MGTAKGMEPGMVSDPLEAAPRSTEGGMPVPGIPSEESESLYEAVKLFIRRRVRTWHEAEELVQECFLRLKAQVPPIAAERVRAGLYRTARNRVVDTVRSRQADGRKLEKAARQAETNGGGQGGNPLDAMIQSEERQMVLQLVEKLDDRQKEVVRLKFQEGLTYQEIAEVINKPKTTVAWLLHESILRLRSEMGVGND